MKQIRGSITIFLTLVMVCIISLIGTMLDLARFEIANHLAYNALVTAVDSELTNYCKEIYEDYKIFLLEGGQKSEDMSGEEYVESIKEYLTYSLEPQKDIQIKDISLPLSTTDFLAIELKDCTLKGQTMITDQEGEIFQHQVEEYMKYHVPAELAESLLSKLNLLQNTQTTMSVFRKKMAVEEEAAKISQSVLDLITLVEGLSFEGGELELTNQYFIVIQKSFGKQFCTEKVGPKAVAINHNLVWDSLRDKYINPVTVLTTIQSENEELITLNRESKELKNQLEKETDGEKRTQIEGELSQREDRMQELKDSIENEGLTLIEQAKGMQEKIREAIDIIDGLKGRKEACESKMSEFEAYLGTQKNKLDGGSYKAVTEELDELKEYLCNVNEEGVDTSIIGDVMAMKQCLTTNLNAIEQTVALEPLLQKELDPDLLNRKTEVNKTIDTYKGYTLRPLQFDYTKLNTKPKEESPVGGLGSFVENGICDLILEDASNLSKQSLSNSILPSNNMTPASGEEDEEDESTDLANEISNQDMENSNIDSSMEEYESICQQTVPEENALNIIARRVLLNSYGLSYYKNYASSYKAEDKNTNQEKVLSKTSVLAYEQEYLIMGGQVDEDNVKDIVSRTVFIRTAMNYLSLLTDSKARAKAFATATAMVGFTGCAPLVTVVKHVILMGWGFEEALVDVGALMQGKSVALFKKAGSFSVRFEELLTISKSMVQQKIKTLPRKDKSLLSMTYEDYLNFYMFMVGSDTLSYRMMDLIQENTRLRYKEDFLMTDGIFALEMSLEYHVPDKFLSIPFIKQFTGRTGEFSNVEITTEYSY